MGVQLGGVALFFVWSFRVAFAAFKLFDMVLKRSPDDGKGLSVPDLHEKEGLNLHGHEVPMGSGILQEAMAQVARDHGGNLEQIELDYGDEAYETSVLYNRSIGNSASDRAEEEA